MLEKYGCFQAFYSPPGRKCLCYRPRSGIGKTPFRKRRLEPFGIRGNVPLRSENGLLTPWCFLAFPSAAWWAVVLFRVATPAAIYRSAQGPGSESAPMSAFWVILGIWPWGPESAKNTPWSTLWALWVRRPKITHKNTLYHSFPLTAVIVL